MPSKQKHELEDKTLLENTRERVDTLYDEYDAVFVAHSGGKDSTACFNAVLDGWERNDGLEYPIMPIFHDNETPMPETVDYFQRTAENHPEKVKIWWTVVPYVASLMTHPEEQTWKVPWDERNPEKWVREMPTWIDDYDNIEMMRPDHRYFEDWKMGDRHFDTAYHIIEGFGEEHDLAEEQMLQCVGLRTEESMNRYTAIMNIGGWRQTESDSPCHVGHPVYDWGTDDLWAIHQREGWDYNAFYDNLHQQGVAPTKARNGPVWGAFPIRAQKAKNTRKWYPEMYERWERRYPGCVFAFDLGFDLFDAENMKPDDISWREYTSMILNSFDEDEQPDRVAMVERRLEKHDSHASIPLQDEDKCPQCDMSWEEMARDLLERLRDYYVDVH